MQSFVIKGGTPLYGSVRLGGAKNASYKLMIASLLSEKESRLLNFSNISDVRATAEIIEKLGGSTQKRGEGTMFIDPSSLKKSNVPDEYGPKSRSAPMFIPALLHRLKEAKVPHPGGDKIGKRPLDRHWQGLQRMGAKIEQTSSHITAKADKLYGTTYTFPKNTHTGTETLLMAAVLAEGKTVLENSALEPEVDDLITFLNSMGARIRRRHNRCIEIEGVESLGPTIHRIMPDRNEAISYACAAVATKGDIIVENAKQEHLQAFLDKLSEMGGGYEIGSYGIRFYYKGPLRAVDITTQPHPGFMTDWQPLWAVLLTQTQGTSIIHEAIYPTRFQYISHLNEMGVQTELFNPQIDDPERIYNFDVKNDNPQNKHAVKITGGNSLKSGEFTVKDLRHGATLTLAAIIAEGESIIHNVEEIDRGYENLDKRLRSLGANIERKTA
ncbi:UDP-N-acetylglucosamine 1-carboxyvinyltransferase [Patescibacteria group bacterium]